MLILSHKSLHIEMGGDGRWYDRRTNISTKHCYFVWKSDSSYKDKDCMTDVTFIRSILVLHAENSVPKLFFSDRLYPQKGH